MTEADEIICTPVPGMRTSTAQYFEAQVRGTSTIVGEFVEATDSPLEVLRNKARRLLTPMVPLTEEQKLRALAEEGQRAIEELEALKASAELTDMASLNVANPE